ncbi:hypothetical protein Si091_00532 [Streptococcus infantarius subsp. infantarius]|nr:hypothetical protein [Streptococcus infantarius subsp. infantarius]
MEFKVKNKIIEIKFDYRTMFKVDKQLATKNKDTGASNNDGVGTLFNNILNRNDEGLVDLILLSANKAFSKAISEDDAITAIETWLVDNDADDTESLFEEIQQDMVDSGFFKNKILKYIKGMQKALNYLTAKDDVDPIEVEAVKDMISEMQNALS